MKTKVRTSALPGAWTVILHFAAAAIVLALLAIPDIGHAQGIVRGAQEGAYEGSRVAGPVGGVVGGAVGAGVGGAVGAVNGRVGNPLSRLSLPRLLQPLRSFPLLSVTN